MVKTMKSMGFGFTEIGTTTPIPQDGNQNLECLDILNINLFKMQWDSII